MGAGVSGILPDVGGVLPGPAAAIEVVVLLYAASQVREAESAKPEPAASGLRDRFDSPRTYEVKGEWTCLRKARP